MKNVLLWILTVIMLVASIDTFGNKSLVGGVIFALLAVVSCPILWKKLKKDGKKIKKSVLIPVYVVLFMVAATFLPTAEDTQTSTDNVQQESSEQDKDDDEDVNDDKTVDNGDVESTESNAPSKENDEKETTKPTKKAYATKEPTATPTTEPTEKPQDEEKTDVLTVHYIDVGQGSCTLLTCGGEALVIDAGDNSKGTLVQNYIKKQGVEKISVFCVTHGDADHCGGADVLINKFQIDTLLMHKEDKDTNTYRDVLDAAEYKNLKITEPKAGNMYSIGSATIKVLSPSSFTNDSNMDSIVLLIKNGNNSFLFTGDAEEEAEKNLVKNYADELKDVTVYMAGHHGSKTSSSEELLDAMPYLQYCVISVGMGNSYGHPTSATLNKLREREIKVFRTDEQGTIVCNADGKTLEWNCSPSITWQAGESKPNQTNKPEPTKKPEISQDNSTQTNTYNWVLNSNSKKIHYPSCSSVERMAERNKVYSSDSLEELLSNGYTKCQNCFN